MKKLSIALLVTMLSLFLTACGQGEEEAPADDAAQKETTEEETSEDEEEEEEVSAEPGEIHLEYPTDVSTVAEEGDFVLAPSRSSLDDALASGESSTMIFYSRVMVEPGEIESVVEEFSEEVNMPNSLIVPIKPGQTAQPGDIVLTWWQSGSGMTRAIIVEGGTEREPMAKYLDLSFDYDADTLKLDSFHVLTEEMEPGTAVAVRDGGEYNHEIVINVSGDKVLTSGFASVLYVRDMEDITPIPIKPEVAVGDTVYIPVIGTYKSGEITAIDEANGKVTVSYEWVGSTSEEDFPFGDVIKEL